MTKLQSKQIARLVAKESPVAQVFQSREHFEATQANGVYHTKMLSPYESDRADVLRLNRLIAQLETKALLTRMSEASRIALYQEVDELGETLKKIDFRVVAEDEFSNVVATVGKNQMLDAALAGSGYSVTGPYIGLISEDTFSAVAAADTMASHAGWREGGATYDPTYTGTRKTAAWSAAAAGAKALSAASSFTINTNVAGHDVVGCFMVFGSGASATIDNTSGVLWSAGAFSGGNQPVIAANVLNVSYSTSL